MRIFTRYILREVVGYALLGGVLFTFILFMRYLLPLMELAVRGAASPADILRIIGYLLPYFLTLSIPMAVLIGILLGLSRLSADSEVTAMRASGLGVLSFVRIVGIFALFAWAVCLGNTLYVAPRAAAALLQFEDASKSGQAAIGVQPRVFYEGLKNSVLYVQDALPGANGASIWRHVFLADLTQPSNPHIVTSEEAIARNGGPQTLIMQLADGTRHDIDPKNPDQYNIVTFTDTEQSLQIGQQEDTHISRRDTPIEALSLRDLWQLAHGSGETKTYLLELHRRFSWPAACFVLMLVAVPLGLSSKRGGKGTAFVVTLFLVLLYYVLSFVGVALARDGKLPAFAGVWGANLLFTAAGLLLIQQLARGGIALSLLSGAGNAIAKLFSRLRPPRATGAAGFGSSALVRHLRSALRIRFPLILDEYVMGSTVRNFILVLASLSSLFLVFTFFELIGDIIKYRTPLVTVGEYLLNLIPFILYNVTPLCALVAVLITFGALSRTSELTAMKATGTSLYRVVAPVLLIAAILSASLFIFDEAYLPAANRKQEALRAVIKGKPAQTFLRPDRKWMSGQTLDDKEPTRIFYYQFFDPDRDVFANLTVFEFKPGSFTLTRRIFATSARWDDSVNRWVFENGWQRTFNGDTIATYQPFTINTFPEIHEQPSYFKKEDRQSQEMSYSELTDYITDLKQSGFDTTRLRVQLNRKIAYPLMALVMAILAVPFALSAGKKGNLAGMGAGIALAIVYWVVALFFENLGNVNTLPAVLAAWSPDILFAIAGSYLLLRVPT